MEHNVSNELFMFYNVENLFLPDHQPWHKFNFKPSGLWNWNSYRYHNKIHKLSHVFELVKEQYGKLPLFTGVAEVQGKAVLTDLLEQDVFKNYHFVHYDSQDERGIDVALLYDISKLELINSEAIPYKFEIEGTHPIVYDTTRDVLHCRFRYKGEIMNIFVVHLPSKREKNINKPKRAFILNDIKTRIIEILNTTDESAILCGDFNENPDDLLLKNLTIDNNFNKILTNPSLFLYNNRNFSTFHYKDGLLFDQFLFSEHFFRPEYPIRLKNMKVFHPEKISSWERKFQGRPFRTYSGTRYLGGYSDHFPVLSEIETN